MNTQKPVSLYRYLRKVSDDAAYDSSIKPRLNVAIQIQPLELGGKPDEALKILQLQKLKKELGIDTAIQEAEAYFAKRIEKMNRKSKIV